MDVHISTAQVCGPQKDGVVTASLRCQLPPWAVLVASAPVQGEMTCLDVPADEQLPDVSLCPQAMHSRGAEEGCPDH